jgi:hypothetical protein
MARMRMRRRPTHLDAYRRLPMQLARWMQRFGREYLGLPPRE